MKLEKSTMNKKWLKNWMLLTLTKKIEKLKKENLKVLMKKLQIVLTQEKQK